MSTLVKEKRVMPVGRQIYLLKVVSGIAWIVAGISHCFDSLFFDIVQFVAMSLCVCVLFWVQFSKKEKMDEMAEQDLMKAQSITMQIMHICLCIVACGVIIFEAISRNAGFHMNVEWTTVLYAGLFLYMGIEDLLTGVLFKRNEEE